MATRQTIATAKYQAGKGYKVISFKLSPEQAIIAEMFSEKCAALGLAKSKQLASLMDEWLTGKVNPITEDRVNPIVEDKVNPITEKDANLPDIRFCEACEKPIFNPRANQKTCSPLPGQKKSACKVKMDILNRKMRKT